MKETLTAVARKFLSPSMRYEMRLLASKVREVLARACFWRWEVARFRMQQESPYEILYIGRKQQREMAKLLIGGKGQGSASVVEGASATAAANHVVVISEMPTTGALSVPHYLSAVVPLGRPLEDITARYDSELRRSIRKNRPLYQMRKTLSDDEIAMADRSPSAGPRTLPVEAGGGRVPVSAIVFPSPSRDTMTDCDWSAIGVFGSFFYNPRRGKHRVNPSLLHHRKKISQRD